MVVATGFFDGVHIGHRLVIDQLTSAARDCGDESLVITFWPHPRTVLQKEAASLRFLTSLDEKKRRLAALGVDHIAVLDFTREFSRLSAKDYLRQYVMDRFGGTKVVFGYDNRIGHEGCGENVLAVAKELGLGTIVAPKASSGTDIAVSSSWIRSMIEAGNIGMASRMLGYYYPLTGVVVSGERIGRGMGFPTANMQLYEPLKLIPCNGVYLVSVRTLGRDFFGMCNIGNRPTVREGNARTIETNIFDFDEDIYGLDIEITFLKRIRPETKFSSLEALKEQLSKDKAVCLDFLK